MALFIHKSTQILSWIFVYVLVTILLKEKAVLWDDDDNDDDDDDRLMFHII